MAYWSQGVTVVLVALALAGVETTGEVEALRDTVRESPSQEESDFYNKIQGFAMIAGATEHSVDSAEACKAKCSPDANCASASWNSEEKKCVTSSEALSYDPNYNLYLKKKKDPSSYNDLPGMVYKAGRKEPSTTGQPKADCENACTGDKGCEAFSYSNNGRQNCYLSSKPAVTYSPGFVYFEKKGVDAKIAKENEALDGGEFTPPSKEEAAANDPEVQALEIKEKAEEKAAAAAKAAAEAEKAKFKQERDELVKEAGEKVDMAKAQAASKAAELKKEGEDEVAKREKAFNDQKEKDFENKKQTFQLEFAANEIQQKNDEKETTFSSEQAEDQRLALETKEIAEKTKFATLSNGEKTAMLDAKQVKIDDQKKVVEEEEKKFQEKKANFETGDAEGSKKELKEKADAAKEAGQKKKEEDAKELQQKTDAGRKAENADEKSFESKLAAARAQATKEADDIREKAQESASKRVSEAGEKNARNNEILQNQTQQSLKASLKKQAQDQKAVEAANLEAQEAEKKSLQAQAEAAKASALAKVEEDKVAASVNQTLASEKVKQQAEEAGKEQEAQEQAGKIKENSEKKQRAEEASTKKAEAAARQEAAENAQKEALKASEGAQKMVKAADEKSEKAAASLEKQRKDHEEAASKAGAKLREVEAETRVRIESNEKSNKQEATKIREHAESEAATIQAQAEAEAEVTKQRANELASKHIHEKKVLGAKEAGLSTATFQATESAFVDSGSPMKGMDMAQLRLNVQKTTREAQEAKKKVDAAQQDLDDAKKQLADSEASVHTQSLPARRKLLQVENATEPDPIAQERAEKDQEKRQKEAALAAANAARAEAERNAAAAKAQALHKETQAKAQHRAEQQKAQHKAEEDKEKATMRAEVNNMQAALDKAVQHQSAKDSAVTLSQQAVAAASLLNSNIAFGKLPEMHDYKGYLRIQKSPEHEQDAFIRFPVISLSSNDVVTDASLRLYKFGGGVGPAIVRLSSCAWSRDSITYTIAQDFASSTVSHGTTIFPEGKDVWVTIPLDGAMINTARLAGDNVCLQVSGGPATDPVIISSEMTDKRPELEVVYKQNLREAKNDELGAGNEEVALSESQFRAQKKNQLRQKFTEEALERNRATLMAQNEKAAQNCAKRTKKATTGKAKQLIQDKHDVAGEKQGKSQQEIDQIVANELAGIRTRIENQCARQKAAREQKYKNLSTKQQQSVEARLEKALVVAMATYSVNAQKAGTVHTLDGDTLV